MQAKYTYEILAGAFYQEDVCTCFALLGDANMSWAAALADLGCDFIYVRDEHCAVAAAMAWSRTNGEVGVATVTCGPGLTQIMTALPAAVRAAIPLVIFAGEAPLGKSWYNQQIEQRALVEACGASYLSLHHIPTMPLQIRDAFLAARSNRQPVVIGVPFDLQESLWSSDSTLPLPSRQLLPENLPIVPPALQVERACVLIGNARRIIVMAGRGAVESDALDACKRLASRVGALLAETLPARGAFYDDEFNLGIAGGFSTDTARRCLQQADLIIAVGCRLARHNSDDGKLFGAGSVLQIDIEPVAISQGRAAAAYHIHSDARLGVEAILQELSDKIAINAKTEAVSADNWRSDQVAAEIRHLPADAATFDVEEDMHDPREVVQKLNGSLPMSWYLVNSSGHCSYFFAQMPGRPVDRFLTIREFGAIGNGIAFAIGVATAKPEQTVVLFDGDGSLLMHIQELETIRRHQLNILICVLNDGAYGSEIHKLRAEGLNEQGAVFGRPDFAAIARGFGIEGCHVRDLAALDLLVEQFSNKPAPALWDFHISDKVVSPVIRRSHQS